MKRSPSTHRNSPHRQRGQAMTEYLAIGLVLVIALFLVPVTGSNPPQTVAQFLAGRIHDLYDNISFFLSLP